MGAAISLPFPCALSAAQVLTSAPMGAYAQVYWSPENLGAPAPPAPLTEQRFDDGYFDTWSFEHFVRLLNLSWGYCFNDVGAPWNATSAPSLQCLQGQLDAFC
ncbi:MAG: hypothetical protein Q7U97_12990, partial [Rhodocyclaceae bacterium]|nr:hypothetical protein [Rhodocyclaceae bacterium]